MLFSFKSSFMKNMLLFLFLLSGALSLSHAQNIMPPAIIPAPLEMELMDGSFTLNKNTFLFVPNKIRYGGEASYLQSLINEIMGEEAYILETINSEDNPHNYIEIREDLSLDKSEDYKLEIAPFKIIISAKDPHGVFNAIQTIRQMLPINKKQKEVVLPALKIEDSPAFEWRGMHLDVSRHFFSLDYLKQHIDRLAFYKFNKFHLHLTDDQGWRIEIKKYPELTKVGAWRTFNNQDKECIELSKDNPDFTIDPQFIHQKDGKTIYGGFYTQNEIKELIQYAADRHIEIIPEIDMPGHMMAAIESYPYLIEGKASWGDVFSTPLCPCKEDVYEFCEGVLSEIIDLFPSDYIHIGADEVDKKTWQESALCKEFMRQNDIEPGQMDKLQSYFVHRIQSFVESKGKKIIAWDEVLDGGADSDITVMYWRTWVRDSPLNAVTGGSKVIMTPTNPLYFDYPNNSTSVDNVYHMDVVYKNIPVDKESFILGAQANLWTEIIPNQRRAEYQMYPRMLALSERVWTNNTSRFENFSDRLMQHYTKLDAMNVNYRLPDIEGFVEENVYVGKTEFFVSSPFSDAEIHYTLDGSIPTANSPILSSPISISSPTLLKMALFTSSGVRGEIYSLNFKPTEIQKSITLSDLKPGLTCGFFGGGYKTSTALTGSPDQSFTVANIQVPKESDSFGLKFDGYIYIPETGIYSFFFTCDDGGILYIGDQVVVDNDGLHSPLLKSGQIALEKGLHPFKLDFIEGGGGYTLKLDYSYKDSKPESIPDSWFKHK